MKEKLDALVLKYETKDFIKDDPIQFARNFGSREDIEIAAFLSAMFAFGKREIFIQKLKNIFAEMKNKPHNFILNYNKREKNFDGFVYRFIKECDLKDCIEALHNLYGRDKSSLAELFKEGGSQNVCNYFYKNTKCGTGLCFMLSNPAKGGASKRYNMYLRWMVRKGPVDLGLWDFIKPSELLIPLDVHVARVSRKYGLLKRKSNDFKAVIELTEKLKEFDPKDPVKYDFALFGLGVNDAYKE